MPFLREQALAETTTREGLHMKPGLKYLMCTACAVAIIPSMLMLVGNLQAQQVPIPQTAAEVPGPAPGPMTTASVQSDQSFQRIIIVT
jgi:hypothetical protein